MNKFWNYDSGLVKIDEQLLNDFLSIKGVKYFKPKNDNYKYIVIFLDNKVEVYTMHKLWRFCCWLVDKEFTSITEEERTHVKKALKGIKEKLKKSNLSQFKIEDLEKCEGTETINFIKGLIAEPGVKKGGLYE